MSSVANDLIRLYATAVRRRLGFVPFGTWCYRKALSLSWIHPAQEKVAIRVFTWVLHHGGDTGAHSCSTGYEEDTCFQSPTCPKPLLLFPRTQAEKLLTAWDMKRPLNMKCSLNKNNKQSNLVARMQSLVLKQKE